MDLVRDLLDLGVVDRHGQEIGRVDGIVIRDDGVSAPRVVSIEMGPVVLGHRFGRTVGRVVEAVEHALGVDEGRPVCIPVQRVIGITEHVRVDVTFAATAATTIERRLRRWVRRIPGAR